MSLPTPREINSLILLELDYLSILEACRTNTQLRDVCTNQYFWFQKVSRDFGAAVPERNPSDQSYHQEYVYLMNLMEEKDPLIRAALDDRADGIFAALEIGYRPSVKIANWAASRGDLALLQQMESQILPDTNGANYAAGKGHAEVMTWLVDRGILPDRFSATYAAGAGTPRIVQTFIDQGIFPYNMGANYAAMKGDLETLTLLKEHSILPDALGVTLANMYRQPKVVNWLAQQNIA